VTVALGVVVVVAAAWISLSRFGWPSKESASPPTRATFTRLTDQPGEELFPSLSPDGKSLLYASAASGNWDIYLQRVSGKNPINLTEDSPADDIQPAFSPDGEQIAFRSERDGGGIFMMGPMGSTFCAPARPRGIPGGTGR
jgi:dipeptidyl aminopeptidase/acylaminoacyl peptidase